MTNADSTTEAHLSDRTGIPRNVLARIRRDRLEEAADFGNVPGSGITYTPGGLEKIARALAEMGMMLGDLLPAEAPKKNSAAPEAVPDGAEEVLVLVVARMSGNGGASCLCHAEGTRRRCWVTVPEHKLKCRTLRQGMRLEGCRRRHADNPELFGYYGPVPSRMGLPIPEKKEARP